MEAEKLTIAGIEVSSIGRMTVRFNKRIDTKVFGVIGEEGEPSLRALQSGQYDAKDLFEIKVMDVEETEGFLDKGIANYTLTTIDDTSLSVDISFKVPTDVSSDVKEPDVL